MKTINQIFVAFVIACAISSCQKEEFAVNTSSEGSASTTSESSNAKAINLSSSPGETSNDYQGIMFDIEKVAVFVETKGWVEINAESQSVENMNIENGAFVSIAQAEGQGIDASSISKIKLVFGEENYVFTGGLFGEEKVQMNFQASNEAIIDVEHQQASDGQFFLNIDLDKSIIKSGTSVIFNPTISFLADIKTGIKGSVDIATQAMVTLKSEALAYHTFLSNSGEFMIRDVEEGTYDLIVIPISGNISLISEAKILAVTIVEGRITTTGNLQF
ncbi:MAG: hypothetical protein V4622_07890 [Bacteroidota bacterium]